MPLGKGIRFRFKRLGKGKAVRLAFKGNKVVEAAPFKSKGGKLHKDPGFSHDIDTHSGTGKEHKKMHRVMHGMGQM